MSLNLRVRNAVKQVRRSVEQGRPKGYRGYAILINRQRAACAGQTIGDESVGIVSFDSAIASCHLGR